MSGTGTVSIIRVLELRKPFWREMNGINVYVNVSRNGMVLLES